MESTNAGTRRRIVDALGSLAEYRDSKGALLLYAYDYLNRPTRQWARDQMGLPLTLRQRFIYGDSDDSGLTRAQAISLSLLGKPYRQYDEAGLLALEHYDFKGNLLEKTRRVIDDNNIVKNFRQPPPNWKVQGFCVDWQFTTSVEPSTYIEQLLDPTVYQTTSAYDALNRVHSLLYPRDVTGGRKLLTAAYNRAGALEHVELDGAVYVERIAYNARRQRSLLVYGNGVVTRYAYDPETFRLVRLRSELCLRAGALSYHPVGIALQDFSYSYDLTGNLLTLNDRTPGSGVPNQFLAQTPWIAPSLTTRSIA
jgi:hypothetical protein